MVGGLFVRVSADPENDLTCGGACGGLVEVVLIG